MSAPAGTKSELISEPIYRFDDPARLFSDGTTWAFGKLSAHGIVPGGSNSPDATAKYSPIAAAENSGQP